MQHRCAYEYACHHTTNYSCLFCVPVHQRESRLFWEVILRRELSLSWELILRACASKRIEVKNGSPASHVLQEEGSPWRKECL